MLTKLNEITKDIMAKCFVGR